MDGRSAPNRPQVPKERNTGARPNRDERQRARQAELEREVADLRSKVANLTETLDKVVGVLASQGLGLDGEHLPPLKKPRTAYLRLPPSAEEGDEVDAVFPASLRRGDHKDKTSVRIGVPWTALPHRVMRCPYD